MTRQVFEKTRSSEPTAPFGLWISLRSSMTSSVQSLLENRGSFSFRLVARFSKYSCIPSKKVHIGVCLLNWVVFKKCFYVSFSFQPVPHDWCNKGCGMCYPVYGMVHTKEPLLLIGKSSPCGGSGFPLSLSEWSFTICPTPYNRK